MRVLRQPAPALLPRGPSAEGVGRHRCIGAGCLLGALVLGSCTSPPSQTGTLNNGSFSYNCINSQDCSNEGALNGQTSLPPVAFGAQFGFVYVANDRATYPNVVVQAVSPAFFATSTGPVFEALRAGTPWFVALALDGSVLDFTPLTVAPIASLHVTDTSGLGDALLGDTDTFTVTAFGASAGGGASEQLYGSVPCSWVSSNPAILAFPSWDGQPSNSIQIRFAKAGTATLTAYTATARGSVSVTVEDIGL